MQAAGHLIGVLVKLATGVQRRHDDFERGAFFLRMIIDRYAATVVGNLHGAVLMEDYVYAITMARESLIDRVVYNLVDEMMEASHADVADIHGGACAHGFQAFQYLNIGCVVFLRLLIHGD